MGEAGKNNGNSKSNSKRGLPKTAKHKAEFLEAFVELGSVKKSAEAIGIERTSHWRWLKEDDAYAEAFESVSIMAADTLEAEAIRRAKDGVDEPVYQSGQLVGTIKKYSDTLLIFLLKGLLPEKYRERYQVNTAGLTDEELEERISSYVRKVGILAIASGERAAADSSGNGSASAQAS